MAETPVALVALGVVGGAFAWTMAAFVVGAGPRAATNRLLGAVLALEGGLLLAFGLPSEAIGLGRAPSLAADVLFVSAVFFLPWLYLLFLARLDAPLARPLRRGRPAVLAALLVYAAAFAGAVAGLATGTPEAGWLLPFVLVAFLALGAASLFGLAVAWSAWRHAERGTLARERAGAYALAFGTRDALLALGIVAFFVEEALAPKAGIHVPSAFLVALSTLLYVPFLAYGVLRTRLLGIEPRLRWTISRGTVAAVFVAVYVVASQATALLVAPRWGTTAGVVAAAALVLALVPLQRASERLAARAVPEREEGVLDDRRLEVYRLALEDVGTDADPRASALLARLRHRLGITMRDHAIVEHVLRTGRRPGGSDDDVRPGDVVLGRFRVERALGEGAHAKAFLAEDEELGRRVVVKAFRPERDAEAVRREGRAVAAVRHPSVVTVHDVAVVGGRAFLVMEHVEGGSLAERLARGPLAPDEFARVARDLADALVAVHAAGLVHRDVKPANVLLASDGRAKLADFGVAALAATDATRADAAGAGGAAGTLAYMSPEQAKGMPTTARSDQYALALTLHEALTGVRYFASASGESALELAARVARPGAPRPPPGPTPALAGWFERALAAAPRERFETTTAMRDELAAALAAASQRS